MDSKTTVQEYVHVGSLKQYVRYFDKSSKFIVSLASATTRKVRSSTSRNHGELLTIWNDKVPYKTNFPSESKKAQVT